MRLHFCQLIPQNIHLCFYKFSKPVENPKNFYQKLKKNQNQSQMTDFTEAHPDRLIQQKMSEYSNAMSSHTSVPINLKN
jgi:hypothetical protein